ncbi:MAG: ABC transporter permease, partial [Chitinophagaceae bacterium]
NIPAGVNAEGVSMLQGLFNQHWALIIFCFLFYFLGGYFLYAAMFAAVGSLVNEDPQEAQQFTLPVTLPIIIGFMIMTSSASNPDSTISVIASIVPFTSPIVMLSRIPFGVPVWQLALSMSLLVAGFIFMTWIGAKIYRTGILMYGKKITWKELWKWLRY